MAAAISEEENMENPRVIFYYRNTTDQGYKGPNNGRFWNITLPIDGNSRDEQGVWRTCGWSAGNPQYRHALFVDNVLRYEWTEGEQTAPFGAVPPDYNERKFTAKSGSKLQALAGGVC